GPPPGIGCPSIVGVNRKTNRYSPFSDNSDPPSRTLVIMLTGTVISRPAGRPSTFPVSVSRHRSVYHRNHLSLPPRRQRKTASGSTLPRRANPPEAWQATLSSRQGHEGALGLILDDEPRPLGGVQRQADAEGAAVVLEEAPRPAVAVRQRDPRLAVAVEQA